METGINAILIHENDNVVTVTTAITKGGSIVFKNGSETVKITAAGNIPIFHKVAVTDINTNAPVYKYGQLIGKAIMPISKGSHVHDHNIMSPGS